MAVTNISSTESSLSQMTNTVELDSEVKNEDRIRATATGVGSFNQEKKQLGFFSKFIAPIFLTEKDMENIHKTG